MKSDIEIARSIELKKIKQVLKVWISRVTK